ncbi:MAG: primosomal protein N' [Planctomycetota bacterium]
MTTNLFQPELPQAKTVGYAAVICERSFDRLLTYSIPDDLDPLPTPGMRVEVPLGRGSIPTPGTVIETCEPSSLESLAPDLDPSKVKPILRSLEGGYSAELILLARWIAGYYAAPLGMTLSTMMPAAVKSGVGKVRRLAVERAETIDSPTSKLPPATAQAWQAIQDLDPAIFPVEPKPLARLIESKSTAPINRLVKLGYLNLIEIDTVRVRSAELSSLASTEKAERLELTADQITAVTRITDSLGRFATHLLLGVTGSGKTEVYLRVLEAVLERGESAIVLVPEISLTPQTAARFVGRFAPFGVEVLHSGLTAAQRNRAWSRIAAGEARVVVGARSAIFAPIDTEQFPLGLVVVDEEHDSSYKQDQVPRYHARDVAIKRASLARNTQGCPIILGSATPALESFGNAMQGRFNLIELPKRAGGGQLPPVRIVDLQQERKQQASRRQLAIGPTLSMALRETLDRDEQAILLLNRRGYASYIACADQLHCGWIMGCDDCDTTLVYHKQRLPGEGDRTLPVVRCHHCLSQQRLPAVCPVCSSRLILFNAGTQKIEEELLRDFPELAAEGSLRRLDSDSMRTGRDYAAALDAFRRGETRVLLGTQMLAKGLDFPGVTLVGVINADTALNIPDFRSAERTFQLVSQVAGRAGRKDKPGRVIVQTMNPNDPTIGLASSHDYVAFAKRELAVREINKLPPAWRLARVIFRDEDANRAHGAAVTMHAKIREVAEQHSVRVRTPMPCAISRIGGKHRYELQLSAPAAGAIQRVLEHMRRNEGLKSDAEVAIDVDPVSML